LNVALDAEEPAFEVLEEIFSEYWEQATPLTQETLDEYLKISSDFSSEREKLNRKIEKEVEARIGKVEFPNIKRGDDSKRPESKLLSETLLKRYQLFLGEFRNLRKIYESVGERKLPEDILPLRIEIDHFLSWIRDKKAYRQTYKDAPRRWGKELEDFVVENIRDFLASGYEYINYLASQQYPTIKANLSSESVIDSWTEEQAAETALIIHAFSSRARYYGGKNSMVKRFIEDNGLDKIKKTFKYLLFGEGEFTQRVAACVIDPKYKLKHFGRSCVQEAYGWANNSDVPLCNERTFKSMQWLGFGDM